MLKFGRAGDFDVGEDKLLDYNGARQEKDIIEWAGKQLATCAQASRLASARVLS